MLKESRQKFVVEGSGKTEKEAMDMCFMEMRKQLVDLEIGYIAHATPVAVEVVTSNHSTRIEKYLFFFLPKEITTFEFKLEIEVEIKYIIKEKD
ncbi:MAG: DUF4312 family protein [Mycoplasmatales bacterium]